MSRAARLGAIVTGFGCLWLAGCSGSSSRVDVVDVPDTAESADMAEVADEAAAEDAVADEAVDRADEATADEAAADVPEVADEAAADIPDVADVEEDEGAAEDGGDGGDGGTTLEDDYCAEFMRLFCGYASTCCTADEQATLAGEGFPTDCSGAAATAMYTSCHDELDALLSSGHATLDAAAWPACRTAIDAAADTCVPIRESVLAEGGPIYRNILWTCRPVVVGSVATGDACGNFLECIAADYCDRSSGSGTCQPSIGAGDSCTHNEQCVTGLVCIAGACAAPSATGGPCDENEDCDVQRICDSTTHLCTPFLDPGSPCDPTDSGNSDCGGLCQADPDGGGECVGFCDGV